MGNSKSSQSQVGALYANKSDNYDDWDIVEDQAGELKWDDLAIDGCIIIMF